MKLSDRNFSVRIGEGFTVCEIDEENDPGWFRIHPNLKKMPNGRLILSVNRDRDIEDFQMLMFRSDDDGQSWQEFTDWPTSSRRGHHLLTKSTTLDNGEVLTVASNLMLTAADKEDFSVAIWRSLDGGETWGEMEAAPFEMPPCKPFDLYNPPQWFLDEHEENYQQWRKPEIPLEVKAICDQLGHRRILGEVTLFALSGKRVLAFAYLFAHFGEPLTVHCLQSDDGGRNWQYLSTPGPFEERYRTENQLTHQLDGLCEPSCTRLKNGDLLLVMRLGSRHPLYAVRSSNEGRTWTTPRPLPVHGIWPTLETLPDGVLALCSGRPDVSLSFSFDYGYRWPWTYRFLEDGNPEDPSTRNNTMLQIEPGRLLYMYDHGGYHEELPPEFRGPRRVTGHFIDVETNL